MNDNIEPDGLEVTILCLNVLGMSIANYFKCDLHGDQLIEMAMRKLCNVE